MNGIVQIGCLGNYGRWGNMLFQYAFARTYAERLGATLETPKWIGQWMFGLTNNPISCSKPTIQEVCLSGDPSCWKTDVDLIGYFQLERLMKCVSKSKVLEWYKFIPEITNKFPKRPGKYAACHLRQGDYVSTFSSTFCNITRASYEKAVAEHVPPGYDVVWVEEDKPTIDPSLPGEVSFLPDFFTLLNADILFRANSTFSWWAGELAPHEAIYSPEVGRQTGQKDVNFVAGNSAMCSAFDGYGKFEFAP